MLTVHAAARLLADAADLRALAALAATCGLGGAPAPLDAGARRALALPVQLRRVQVARGEGALRALLVELPAGAPVRELVARTAARLAARAPQLAWLLVATERGGHAVAIAAWQPTARGAPRLQALLVDRRRVVQSDAETLCALAAAREGLDLLTHQRWCEVLGRDALTRRFYRELERLVGVLAADLTPAPSRADAHDLALLCTSRLLFLAFLQAKGWLDGDRDWLAHAFARCMERGGQFHRRVLEPLWFGTLNTPLGRRAPTARALGRLPFLNGGLFARTPVETRCRAARFSDAALAALLDDLLVRYRFTAREDATTFSDAAIDPEMLGRAFESLMAGDARRASGAFYTPQALVETVTTEALAHALATSVDEASVRRLLAGDALEALDAREASALRERLAAFRLLDPSCGSGAFLVHALERLATLRQRLGDTRSVPAIRRAVLGRSIFGVDANPMAVWLCELRLWLSVVIDDETTDVGRVPPLPNLDHHVRTGDALAGDAFDAGAPSRAGGRLAAMRERYARATGRRKHALARALDREERTCALAALDSAIAVVDERRRDALAAARSRDLFGERRTPPADLRATIAALREEARALRVRRRAVASGGALPFAFAAHFADVGAAGGFDVVLGNPPWVRLHHIPPDARQALRRRYRCFREAAWRAGAAEAGAAHGFAGQGDLAGPFVERALDVTRLGGVVALLLPAKLWCALAGGGVRALLARDARVLALEDWSAAPATFDAAVYPSLLVARRGHAGDAMPVRAARHHRTGAMRWEIAPASLALDDDPASPWLAVPPAVRAAFDRVARAGIPLARSVAGRPLLGVKSGCNEAFVTTLVDDFRTDGLALVRSGADAAPIERAMLRPLLRGQDLAAWSSDAGTARLVWTHDAADRPMRELPPHARAWLARWRPRLAARADARRAGRWWSLFRTEAARADLPRVAWADFGRTPRATVLDAGDPTVPLNTCYVARCPSDEDALALAALLNGPLAAAWLALVAEPARGGWKRFLGWTMARLPVPADWPRARAILAPLADAGRRGDPPSPLALADAALAAYGVRRADIEPLLTWTHT